MITLITGGARSGKSSFAEKLLKSEKDVVYIATAEVYDQEMKDRVAHHVARRPDRWRTFEGFRYLDRAIGLEKHYLIDCITNLVSREQYEHTKNQDKISSDDIERIEKSCIATMSTFIDEVVSIEGNLIIVTNEIGNGLVPMDSISRGYRDIHGRVNQYLALRADQVYLVVSGIEVKIK